MPPDGPESASNDATASGSAARSAAATNAESNAAAMAATASIWAVTVLVAGTARSGPASVSRARSHTCVSGLPGSLAMPMTTAPARRMDAAVSTTSGVAPDWLSATTR